MRTASDFDRPFPGESAADNLFGTEVALMPAVRNVYIAGVKVVATGVGDVSESDVLRAKAVDGDSFAQILPYFTLMSYVSRNRCSLLRERPAIN